MCYHQVIIIVNGLTLHCFIYFAREKHQQPFQNIFCLSDVLERHFRGEVPPLKLQTVFNS